MLTCLADVSCYARSPDGSGTIEYQELSRTLRAVANADAVRRRRREIKRAEAARRELMRVRSDEAIRSTNVSHAPLTFSDSMSFTRSSVGHALLPSSSLPVLPLAAAAQARHIARATQAEA